MTRSEGSSLAVITLSLVVAPALLACRHPEAAAQAAPPAPRQAGIAAGLADFQQVAQEKTAGVVYISTSRQVPALPAEGGSSGGLREQLLDRFFGPAPESRKVASLGSGFIVGPGEVLTNCHVVEGADEISIELTSGRKYRGQLVGLDARTDVALVRFAPREALTVLELGNSDEVRVGEWVMAIGNPFGLSGSATVGVISFMGRPLTLGTPGTSVDMMQTDASINPGNSGGPLLDMNGRVIGINTMIMTPGLPQSAGVGFAVPINVAKEILPQLRKKGRVARGWLGVLLQPLSAPLARSLGLTETRGALVSDVVDGGPAQITGVVAGDVILGIDDAPVDRPTGLSEAMGTMAPGRGVQLRLWRAGVERTLRVVLGVYPEPGRAEPRAARPARDRLGLALSPVTPQLAGQLGLPPTAPGLVVVTVEPDSAAAAGGLQRGDLILTADGQAVGTLARFQRALAAARQRGVSCLRLRRDGAHLFAALPLAGAGGG
ncbi:MAG TPA: trypsin-like peptidase domain-containing protein [Vicinamibacteria bacterium]